MQLWAQGKDCQHPDGNGDRRTYIYARWTMDMLCPELRGTGQAQTSKLKTSLHMRKRSKNGKQAYFAVSIGFIYVMCFTVRPLCNMFADSAFCLTFGYVSFVLHSVNTGLYR